MMRARAQQIQELNFLGFESLLALPPGLPFEFGAIGVTTDELQVRAHIVIDALARAEMCWRADFIAIQFL